MTATDKSNTDLDLVSSVEPSTDEIHVFPEGSDLAVRVRLDVVLDPAVQAADQAAQALSAVTAEQTARAQAIADEATARQQGDAAVAGQINSAVTAEALARSQADDAIRGGVATGRNTLKKISDDLDSETTSRQAAIDTLTGAVDGMTDAIDELYSGPWTAKAAAGNLQLDLLAGRRVTVTGGTQTITSLGVAVEGDQRLIFVSDNEQLFQHSSTLKVDNGGRDYLAAVGDVLMAVAKGGAWYLARLSNQRGWTMLQANYRVVGWAIDAGGTGYTSAIVTCATAKGVAVISGGAIVGVLLTAHGNDFNKVPPASVITGDGTGGAVHAITERVYNIRFSGDSDSQAPIFGVGTNYSRPKLESRSQVAWDPADSVDIQLCGSDGTPYAPVAWNKPCVMAYVYGRPYDTSGRFSPQITAGVNGYDNATYQGRCAQIDFLTTEIATPTARGGALQFCVTRDGTINGVARMWLNGNGFGPTFGGAAVLEESGVAEPYIYNNVIKNTFSPGPVNWLDVKGDWANCNIIGTDIASAKAVAAIAIRKNGVLTTGFDLCYSHGTSELLWATVSGGVRALKLGIASTGELVPASANGSGIGTAAKPFGPVYSQALVCTQPSNVAAVTAFSSNASLTADVAVLEASRAGSSAYNFLRCLSGVGTSIDAEFKLQGDGNAFCDGSWTGGGAGFGEFWEWADGNPDAEDRTGLAVVAVGDKIRPALPGEEAQVFGVISARPTIVGNAAWNRWSGKYLVDELGRRLTEEVETVSWVEVPKLQAKQEIRELVTTSEEVVKTETEWHVRTVTRMVKEDGVWKEKEIQEREERRVPVMEAVQLHDADGRPLFDEAGAPRMVAVPVMEIADHEQVITRFEDIEVDGEPIRHSYRLADVPEGVEIPADAERRTIREPILNPAYDPTQEYLHDEAGELVLDEDGRPTSVYVPRGDRPSWAIVSYLGREFVRAGQPIGPRWVKLAEISPDVAEYLVIP